MSEVSEQATCECLGLFGGDGSQVLQVALVPDQHYDNVGVSVVLQLLQPSLHVLVGHVFSDVVHDQSSHCSSIVPVGKEAGIFLGTTMYLVRGNFCGTKLQLERL